MKLNVFTISLFVLSFTITTIQAQKPVYPKANNPDQIPYGEKLPPPSFNVRDVSLRKANAKVVQPLPYTTAEATAKAFIQAYYNRKNRTYLAAANSSSSQLTPAAKTTTSDFHLTKDINTTVTGSSNPSNYRAGYDQQSFAVRNGISYFSADDGVHGGELWRSDGTDAGTYLLKDILPGAGGSNISDITVIAGLLYFSAYTDDTGQEPWISDGTAEGTKLLLDLNSGPGSSYPSQFVKANGTVLFASENDGIEGMLWKTDGSSAGTKMIYEFNHGDSFSGYVEGATAANDLYFFTAWTIAYGRELWRSDGTSEGTFLVKDVGTDPFDYDSPWQLTAYNNKLYYSGGDGTARRLWCSDGTEAGTFPVTNSNNVFLQLENLNYVSNVPFAVLGNVLYMGGYTEADGSGLYKFDAASNAGLELVKDLVPSNDVAFVSAPDLRVVGNSLYFKVISSIPGYHDELWTSQGQLDNTKIVRQFAEGEITTNYYNINSTLYFVKDDFINGAELWTTNGTDEGTHLVKDIFTGSQGSFPFFLTPFNGKILFSANGGVIGGELWLSNGTAEGTMLVKDINQAYTQGSEAGFFYRGLGATANGVVFTAYTPELGYELYTSDGTGSGTSLLNDNASGALSSYPNSYLYKNKVNYFIGDNEIGTAIYKTNGTPAGLQRVTAYINRDYSDAHPDYYAVVNFNITDNGQVFYVLFNYYQGRYELWHSNGTATSGGVLSRDLNFNDYTVIIGNTAYFVAGDMDHGFELWKSDGTVSGTKMVRDIHQGYNGSYPYSLFAYKNNIYFGAYDGFGLGNPSLWKSDGTEKGTIKLKNVTPAYYYENFVDPVTPVFCVSNSILYLNATDYNTYGAELWKTNGTASGTKLAKDINPYGYSYPSNLTDVNGTLFFTADDGVHGPELWTSNGTEASTKMVKDISTGYSNYYNFCSAGGKLFFLNVNYPESSFALWSSDGTETNTKKVPVSGLTDFYNISHLTASGSKLFFGANTLKYGTELYVGDATATTFTANVVSSNKSVEQLNTAFDVVVYPNPSNGTAALQLKGDLKTIRITMTDMSGKTVWQKDFSNQRTINLPVEKISAGVYMVTVKTDSESKSLKFVKE